MMLRKATAADARVLARNNLRLAEESEGEYLAPATVLAGVGALLADRRKGYYLVAVERNAVVGQLMVTYEWSDWRNSNLWWVQSVYVLRSWRRRGVFRALFSEVRRRAARNGVKVLRLYVFGKNKRAMAVYRKVGMEKKSYRFYQLEL